MSNFARNLVKKISDNATHILEDGLNVSESSGTIDTGSFLFNAQLSTSIYGGVQDNKVTIFAGESATGKTFFVLAILKHFQDQFPDGIVVYYDTEAAVTKDMMSSRGVDIARVIIVEKSTVSEFKTHLLKLLAEYKKIAKSERPRMMVVLDSLGQLSTTKEMSDSLAGKETRDMTRAQEIKAAFRTLQIELAGAYVPLLLTNHVYKTIGFISVDEASGGSGPKYAASATCMLTKKKDREGDEIVGNIITVKLHKSRFSREHTKTHVQISYDKGLNRYYGLDEFATDRKLFKKEKAGNSYKYILPDGSEATAKELAKRPEKYYTKEILDLIDAEAKKVFSYGTDDEDGETPENIS